MPTYDSKLADWFKQVEKQEQEFKARKKSDDTSPQQEQKRQDEAERVQRDASGGHVTARIETPAYKMAAVDSERVAVDASLLDEEEEREDADSSPIALGDQERAVEQTIPPIDLSEARELFDDEEIEQIDDFLSFIGRSAEVEPRQLREPELAFDEPEEPHEPHAESVPEAPAEPEAISEPEPVPAPEPELELEPELDVSAERAAPTRPEPPAPRAVQQPPAPAFHIPEEQRKLDLCEEGTGEPLPVSELIRLQRQPEPETPMEAPEPAPAPRADTEHAEQTTASEHVSSLGQEGHPSASAAASAEVQAGWDRMPAHLRMLFASPSSEVAQNSYKTFKESRAELIQRLLDPVISLEEAARILNVCPTTVRRYTNRGSLKHIRTAGNQRRFRLSDVLTFMESAAGRAPRNAESASQPADGG